MGGGLTESDRVEAAVHPVEDLDQAERDGAERVGDEDEREDVPGERAQPARVGLQKLLDVAPKPAQGRGGERAESSRHDREHV